MLGQLCSPWRSRRCSSLPWVTHRWRVNHQNVISVCISPLKNLPLPGHISGSSMATKILKPLLYGQRAPLRGIQRCTWFPSTVRGSTSNAYQYPTLENDWKFPVQFRPLAWTRPQAGEPEQESVGSLSSTNGVVVYHSSFFATPADET